MALKILSEAVLRLEHKLDILIKHLRAPSTPMHFLGQTCPVCNNPVDYQIDMAAGVVTRKCNCKSGKLPPMYPLTPVAPGEVTPNARTKAEPSNADNSTDPGRGNKLKNRG